MKLATVLYQGKEQPAVFIKVCRGEENLSAEAVEGHPYTHLPEAET